MKVLTKLRELLFFKQEEFQCFSLKISSPKIRASNRICFPSPPLSSIHVNIFVSVSANCPTSTCINATRTVRWVCSSIYLRDITTLQHLVNRCPPNYGISTYYLVSPCPDRPRTIGRTSIEEIGRHYRGVGRNELQKTGRGR
jgi:hypothetical protein